MFAIALSRRTNLLMLMGALAFAPMLAFAESAQAVPPLAAKLGSLVPSSVLRVAGSPFFSKYVFVAEKKSRTLTVWSEETNGLKVHESFPIDFGRGGGNKKRSGDMNTPEGIYMLLSHLQKQRLDFEDYGVHSVTAFTTNYPNLFDRRLGKTGYGIWLHTLPDSLPLTRGSKGCVIVRNDVIQKLANYIVLERTPLLIFDEVPMATESIRKSFQSEFLERVQQWRQAWQSKNLEKYIGFYSENFKSAGMNKERWQKFKSNLNSIYTAINVEVSEPAVFSHRKHAITRFLQSYQSDKRADYGDKTLYWEQEDDGQWRILGETWDAVKAESAYAVLKPLGEPLPARADASLGQPTMDSSAAMNRDLPMPQSMVK